MPDSKKILNCPELNIGRNTNIKGTSDEDSAFYWKLEERGSLVCGGQKAWQNCHLCKGKVGLTKDEFSYLAEFQAKALPGFFLLLTVRCERRQSLREILLSKKESGLDGFENSQPLQVAKDAETKKRLPSTSGKQGIE